MQCGYQSGQKQVNTVCNGYAEFSRGGLSAVSILDCVVRMVVFSVE